ncbi:MAG TPA: zinc-ribbon domain-containing protein, partial [Thermoplasmata archaeon]|nr:zinc-ribbon domain-containing protein [Thermoplasmata archaeon]
GRGLDIAGGFTGKSGLYAAGQAAEAAGQFQSMSAAWHKEHDGAFGQAVNETKTHFQKCPKCKSYVCAEDWNGEAGLCTNDAPSLVTEMQATKAQTRVEQMREHVKTQTLYDGDMEDRATACPTCGKPSGSGKFCQNCGASLAFQECSNCHHKNPMGVPFCGECGTKL